MKFLKKVIRNNLSEHTTANISSCIFEGG